jgi:cholesterol transport system auxiliary component
MTFDPFSPFRRSMKGALLARGLGAAALSLVVAACSSGGSPSTTYDLSSASFQLDRSGAGGGSKVGKASAVRFAVVEPTALAALDAERVAVRQRDGSLAYLTGAQWADRMPKLVQVRLVRALEDAGRLTSVGRSSDRLVTQQALLIDIRRFEIDLTAGRSAVVELSVKRVDETSGRVLAAKVFSSDVPVEAQGAASSLALEEAFAQVAAEIIDWLGRS